MLWLVLLFSFPSAQTLFACETGDVCCPGKMGTNCTINDLCYQKDKENTCKNGGICDPLLGDCACPAGYTGPKCALLTCSNNGDFDPRTEKCVCKDGWTGSDCSECLAHPSMGKIHVCFPIGSGYILWSVDENTLDKWLDGSLISTILENVKGSEFDKVSLPGQRDASNRYLDCQCRTVIDSVESARDSMSSKSTTPHHQDAPNPYLSGLPAYQHSVQTQTQTVIYEEVANLRKTLEEANMFGGNMNSILMSAAMRRRQIMGGSETTTTPTDDTIRVRHTRRHAFLRGTDYATQLRYQKDTGLYVKLVDNGVHTSEEKKQLSMVYEECVNAYERTAHVLSTKQEELELCHDPEVDDDDCQKQCNTFTVGFWIFLALSATMFSMIVFIAIMCLLLAICKRNKIPS